MDDRKKKFIKPECEIVNFTEDDIITASDGANWYIIAPDGEDFDE